MAGSPSVSTLRAVASPLFPVPSKAEPHAVEWLWMEVCKTFGYAEMTVVLSTLLWQWRFFGRARLRASHLTAWTYA